MDRNVCHSVSVHIKGFCHTFVFLCFCKMKQITSTDLVCARSSEKLCCLCGGRVILPPLGEECAAVMHIYMMDLLSFTHLLLILFDISFRQLFASLFVHLMCNLVTHCAQAEQEAVSCRHNYFFAPSLLFV